MGDRTSISALTKLLLMAWELYGAVGTVRIKGVERSGIAVMRDTDRQQAAFHAIPLRSSFDPADERPPSMEHFVVAADEFRPAR
jgi:hypothetical protein